MVSSTIVGERNAGVESRVFDVSVRTPVVLVSTALRREVVDTAAGHAAELSGQVRGLESELLNGFYRGLDLVGNLGGIRVVRLLAFEHDLEINRAAIDRNVVPAIEIGARRHLDEGQGIPDCAGPDAEVDGKLADLFARDRHGLLGVLSPQLSRIRGDCDRFGGRTNRQDGVNTGSDSHLHLDISPFVFAEARPLDGQRVCANRQLEQRVIAGSGADGFGLRARLRVSEHHLDARDQCAGGIRDRSRNGAAITLREQRPR